MRGVAGVAGTFLLRQRSQARETLFRRGALSEPSSMRSELGRTHAMSGREEKVNWESRGRSRSRVESGGVEERKSGGGEVFKVNRRNRKDYARQPTRGGEYSVVVG